MPRTIEEYRKLWQDRDPRVGCSERLMPGTVVFKVSRRSTPMGDGLPFFDDFGHAVEFCRFELAQPSSPDDEKSAETESTGLPGLDMMLASWQRYKSRIPPEELQRRWNEGNSAFDQLLADFLDHGYSQELGDRLMEAANAYCEDLEIWDLYFLPDDLEDLMYTTGDPLNESPEDADDFFAPPDKAAIAAAARAFDMDNPEHNAALVQRMWDIYT